MATDQVQIPKVAGYVRVSSEEQWRKFSPEAQEQSILNLVSSRGWELYNIYRDSTTGKTTNERPELAAMITDSEARLFEYLAIIEVDRLSRDLEDWAHLRKQLERNGVTIIETSSGISSKQKEFTLVGGTKAVYAQYELEVRKERISKGYEIARKYKAHLGKAPLGFEIVYKMIGKTKVSQLVPDSLGAEVYSILEASPKISVKKLWDQLKEMGIKIKPQIKRKGISDVDISPEPKLIDYPQTWAVYRAIRKNCPELGLPERLHDPPEFPKGSLKNKFKDDYLGRNQSMQV